MSEVIIIGEVVVKNEKDGDDGLCGVC